jgi:ribonuclease PH
MRPSYYFISPCEHRDVTAQVLPAFILTRRIIPLELYERSSGVEVLVDVAIVIVTASSVTISACITATNLLAKVPCLVDVGSLSCAFVAGCSCGDFEQSDDEKQWRDHSVQGQRGGGQKAEWKECDNGK